MHNGSEKRLTFHICHYSVTTVGISKKYVIMNCNNSIIHCISEICSHMVYNLQLQSYVILMEVHML